MQPSLAAKADTSPAGQPSQTIDYARTVDELLQLYTRIDMAAVDLPLVGFNTKFFKFLRQPPSPPANGGFWKRVKGSYNGDVEFALVSIRPLVTRMLRGHFRRRLRLLRQRILLETAFSEDPAGGALARIDRALDFWKRHITVGLILFGWFPLLVGPVTALAKWLFPDEVPLAFRSEWIEPTIWILFFSIFYLFIFLGSAFAVKRGLMLGGTGSDTYNPSSLPGQGGYGQERKILGPLGLTPSEFPLDLIFAIPLALFFAMGSYFGVAFALLMVAYGLISWIRRRKLGRS
jgi:hypothetical protein